MGAQFIRDSPFAHKDVVLRHDPSPTSGSDGCQGLSQQRCTIVSGVASACARVQRLALVTAAAASLPEKNVPVTVAPVHLGRDSAAALGNAILRYVQIGGKLNTASFVHVCAMLTQAC